MMDKYGDLIYKSVNDFTKVMNKNSKEYFLNIPKKEQEKITIIDLLNFEMKVIFSLIFYHIQKATETTESHPIEEHTFQKLFYEFDKLLQKAMREYNLHS